MATYWENSCSFGARYVSWYKYLIVSLVFSHLGFWIGNLFVIAPFPDLCVLVPFFHPQLHVYYNIYIVAHLWGFSVWYIYLFQLLVVSCNCGIWQVRRLYASISDYMIVEHCHSNHLIQIITFCVYQKPRYS